MSNRLLMLAGGGGGFSPLSLSPALWLKADAGTFQSDGGAAASADADPVGQWQDQSGNGRHVAQATAARRLSLRTGVQNTRPSVRSDATDDRLTAAFALAQPAHVFIAFTPRTFTASDRVFDGDSNNTMGLYQSSAGGELTAVADSAGNNTLAFAGPAVGSPGIVEVLYGGASSHARLNAGAAATGTLGTDAADGVKLAANGAETVFGDFDFFEVLVFPTALSAANATAVREYLNARWAIY